MAIYHCSIKIFSRGRGKSAVAAAAYRAGEMIVNERDGVVHDYTRKRGIVYKEIILPANAPAEYTERAVLWNAVEKIEKAKNSQLAREIELALPVELSRAEHIALVREYVQQNFVSAGMCADIAIHDKNDGNPHAHIMLTMRPFREGCAWGDKQKKEYLLEKDGGKIYDPKKRQYKCKSIPTTDWNDQNKAEAWRAAWADAVNAHLERQGYEIRVDHRSYERQGIQQIPTVHMGAAASQMERRGIRTDRGNLNRDIELTNQLLRQLRARLSKLDKWLKSEAANKSPSTLADVIRGVLDNRERRGYYQQIWNLKSAAKMLNFLIANDIRDTAGLQEKVQAMYGQFDNARADLKKNERRAKALGEHLRQADTYLERRALYKQYQQIQNTVQRAAFYEMHRADLILYEAANRYLKGVMNGRTALPLQAWRTELGKLAAERKDLFAAHTAIKDEVREVEQIRRGVDDIMRSGARDAQRDMVQNIER